MAVKKQYNIGDFVWVTGISNSNRYIKGQVIKKLDLSNVGYDPNNVHYIISIPTEIEPLLEIRTWETISQDDHGPVGAIRESYDLASLDTTHKKISHLGYTHISNSDQNLSDFDEEPSVEQINAALEQSRNATMHSPIVFKQAISKNKKRYPRKHKQ